MRDLCEELESLSLSLGEREDAAYFGKALEGLSNYAVSAMPRWNGGMTVVDDSLEVPLPEEYEMDFDILFP